jgi:hypothetical protein
MSFHILTPVRPKSRKSESRKLVRKHGKTHSKHGSKRVNR